VSIVSLFLGANLSAIVLGLPPAKARAYKGPADLKGMTIGVTGPGGAAENMLRIILKKGGLALTDVTSIGVGSGATAIAAMETGKIQGIVLADPVIMRLGRRLHLAGDRYPHPRWPDLRLWRPRRRSPGRRPRPTMSASRPGPALRQCTGESCEMAAHRPERGDRAAAA
jgi:NMT1-like family